MSDSKILIGQLECCNLPELGIYDLHLRVDTGAKTSSLHVDDIEEFNKGSEDWIRFKFHPDIHNVDRTELREAKVKSHKLIKSSNASKERRYLIETVLEMAGDTWPIDLTLTDRSGMTYLMLLGRQAMKGRFIVDPEIKYHLKT